MFANDSTREIPIYRLDEDARVFQGKRGDVLLGGGPGESAALRISLPEAFYLWTHADWKRYPGAEDWTGGGIATAYWTMTQAYVFGDGYHALGWRPEKPIEVWLTEHILSFLARHYPSDYGSLLGTEPLEEDGFICRLPTDDEARILSSADW